MGEKDDLLIDRQISAVGLLVSDTAESRLGLVTLLCFPDAAMRLPEGPFAVPRLALAGSEEKRARFAMRALSPLVGELWSFASLQPGGAPARSTHRFEDPRMPAVAIVKKVASSNWAEAMLAAEAMSARVGAVFPALVREMCVETSQAKRLPGDDEDPELSAFSSLVLKNAKEFLERRLAGAIDPERPARRGAKP
jgi:hypothetical protein